MMVDGLRWDLKNRIGRIKLNRRETHWSRNSISKQIYEIGCSYSYKLLLDPTFNFFLEARRDPAM